MVDHPFQRNTAQRQIVLEELQKVTSHPTAADVYEMVRRRMPKISLGTVYRNLELLAERGTIQKLALGGKEARFDGNPDCHYHVRCVRCGRVDDLEGLPNDLVGDKLEQVGGYKIIGHHLEFVGICGECGSEQAKEDSRDPNVGEG